MDNKEKENIISSMEVDDNHYSNDYKVLVQKLKIIRETIDLLERNFLEKES